MARSGSLPYIVVTNVLAFIIAAFMFGMFDPIASTVMAQPGWGSGTEYATDAHRMVGHAWRYGMLAILGGLVISTIAASRRGGGR